VDVTVTVKANICLIAIGHLDHGGTKQANDTAFGSAVAVFLQLPAGSRAWSSLHNAQDQKRVWNLTIEPSLCSRLLHLDVGGACICDEGRLGLTYLFTPVLAKALFMFVYAFLCRFWLASWLLVYYGLIVLLDKCGAILYVHTRIFR
jgi:hypothetical protein